jgi:hypothetical protein
MNQQTEPTHKGDGVPETPRYWLELTEQWIHRTTNFGPGGFFFASTASGDLVGISSLAAPLYVPFGYVSGNPLLDTVTLTARPSPASA